MDLPRVGDVGTHEWGQGRRGPKALLLLPTFSALAVGYSVLTFLGMVVLQSERLTTIGNVVGVCATVVFAVERLRSLKVSWSAEK